MQQEQAKADEEQGEATNEQRAEEEKIMFEAELER
jgi:hypothetical protein